jgi:DNA-directed RNA polymerase alpha subunit
MNNDVSLNTKISNLDLSTRVKNVLQRNKINIVLDLLNIDLNDLQDMRYLGDNSIGELLEFCKLHHIPIGDKETYEKMKNSPIIEEKKEVKDII